MKRLIVGLLAFPLGAFAQVPTITTTTTAPPDSSAKATAVRAAQGPVIDGRETDDVWRTAPGHGDFREFSPKEGNPPRFRTEFKAAFDDRNLYVFVRNFDPAPDSIMRALSRRDVRSPSDQIKLMVDSYFDRRSGYEFAVNPDGVKRDYAMYNDRDEDESWDAIWDVATRIDSAGWTAEFRIPLSQMRYASAPRHTFGFAIWRDIERYKERVSWPQYFGDKNGLVSQLGHLEGIAGISSPQRLEVTPFTVAKNVSRQKAGPTVGYERVQHGTAGADIKYGITPNLTLDATVNPDFGQVEADPAVLNLSAFETFFQETRPFFLEGVGLYNFSVNCSIVNCSGEGLFYSRRIGRTPTVDSYAGIGAPNATPIIGAGKLTGRFPGGLSIGVLEAVTQRVDGTLDRTMEPTTSYTVARVQQEYRGGATTVGAIGTAVQRELDQWTEDFLRRDAYVGGVDFRHKFPGNKYEMSASVMRSRVAGDAAVIDATQQDGVHSFQQPDAGLPYDPTRTSLDGDAEEIAFAKQGGGATRFETSYKRRSPGFEINDLGFLRRADEQTFATWFALNLRKPTKLYRMAFLNFNQWDMWTTSGMATEMAFNTNWHVNLPNNWWAHWGATASQLPGTFCDRCTRGGPAVRRSPYMNFFAGMNLDDRWRVVPTLFFGGGRGDYGASRNWWMEPSLEVRPTSATQMSFGLSLSGGNDDSQWFGNITDGTGTHYTFARLEQRTMSFNTRVSYTMTPALTLQVYAQPFVTRGNYINENANWQTDSLIAVREISATPRASKYEDRYQPYTLPGGPALDASNAARFNVKQLRTNTVLRWEYRPGSTMFVVWSQGRDGFHDKPNTKSWRDEADELFQAHPDNTFLIKLAYWLSR